MWLDIYIPANQIEPRREGTGRNFTSRYLHSNQTFLFIHYLHWFYLIIHPLLHHLYLTISIIKHSLKYYIMIKLSMITAIIYHYLQLTVDGFQCFLFQIMLLPALVGNYDRPDKPISEPIEIKPKWRTWGVMGKLCFQECEKGAGKANRYQRRTEERTYGRYKVICGGGCVAKNIAPYISNCLVNSNIR